MVVGASPRLASFSATVAHDGNVCFAGEMDISCLEALRAALDQVMAEGFPVITLDFDKVSFIDTAAISELLRYQLRAASQRQDLWLTNTAGEVALALDVLDLRHILMDDPDLGKRRSEQHTVDRVAS